MCHSQAPKTWRHWLNDMRLRYVLVLGIIVGLPQPLQMSFLSSLYVLYGLDRIAAEQMTTIPRIMVFCRMVYFVSPLLVYLLLTIYMGVS